MKERKEEGRLICFLPSLYIIAVTLIPILGFGSKGSSLNTYLKALVFVAFFLSNFAAGGLALSRNIRGLCILSLYFVSQIMVLFKGTAPIDIVSFLVQTAMIALLYLKYPLLKVRIVNIEKGIWLYILFNFVAIGYNLIKHFSRYISFSFITHIYYDMYSFFDNKNTYGIVLFIGYILLFIEMELSRNRNTSSKKLIVVLIVIQFVSIMTSSCRTALLCSAVFTLMWLLLIRQNAKKVLLCLLLVLLCFCVFLVPEIKRYILYVLMRVDVDTFRDVIIEGARHLIAESPLFGYGEGGWNAYLDFFGGNMYSHNGYLSVLLTGGIIYFLAYIMIAISCVKDAFAVMKRNHDIALTFIFAFITFGIYSMYEGIIICGTSSANFSFCYAAIILPKLISNALEYNTRCQHDA